MMKMAAHLGRRRIEKWRKSPGVTQQKVFSKLVRGLEGTQFGLDFKITRKTTLESWQRNTPVFDYEDYQERYLPKLEQGQKNVLWKGAVNCFTMSSGTTSGQKLVPNYNIALNSIISTSFLSAFNYMAESKQYNIFKKKIFHLYGLKSTERVKGIKRGYLGHISNSRIPEFLIRSKYPDKNLNDQKTWQDKVEAVAKDMIHHDFSVISGTPPWLNQILARFRELYGDDLSTHFRDLNLLIHGGCPFGKYRDPFFELLGPHSNFWTMEVFPASEGFIAFQDQWNHSSPSDESDLLLNIGSNIFFEFEQWENGEKISDRRYTVADIEVGKTYALVLSTMGSYLSYRIGDCFQVTSKVPLRVKFAGRSRQNVNLIGEHMDFQTLEKIFFQLNLEFQGLLRDYLVLPKIENNRAFYHWIFACDSCEIDAKHMKQRLGEISRESNQFYNGWRKGDVLAPEKVSFVGRSGLLSYLEGLDSVGQNKVPNVVLNSANQAKIDAFFKNNH